MDRSRRATPSGAAPEAETVTTCSAAAEPKNRVTLGAIQPCEMIRPLEHTVHGDEDGIPHETPDDVSCLMYGPNSDWNREVASVIVSRAVQHEMSVANSEGLT